MLCHWAKEDYFLGLLLKQNAHEYQLSVHFYAALYLLVEAMEVHEGNLEVLLPHEPELIGVLNEFHSNLDSSSEFLGGLNELNGVSFKIENLNQKLVVVPLLVESELEFSALNFPRQKEALVFLHQSPECIGVLLEKGIRFSSLALIGLQLSKVGFTGVAGRNTGIFAASGLLSVRERHLVLLEILYFRGDQDLVLGVGLLKH